MLLCRPQHPSGRPNASFSLQEALLAARKVLWPTWEHCCVVRFPSSKGFSGFGVKKTLKNIVFIGVEAIMAESETSSSILVVWLAPEQQFEKVVLWPTPNATLGLGRWLRGIRGRVPARGVPGLWPLRTTITEQLRGRAAVLLSRAAAPQQHSRRAVVGGFAS